MKNKKYNELVLVMWADAWSKDAWCDRETAETSTVGGEPCINVGWVVRHDKEGIMLAGSMSVNDRTIGNLMFIPKGMIKSVKRLKNGDVKRPEK